MVQNKQMISKKGNNGQHNIPLCLCMDDFIFREETNLGMIQNDYECQGRIANGSFNVNC
jgi:hypothetical protein